MEQVQGGVERFVNRMDRRRQRRASRGQREERRTRCRENHGDGDYLGSTELKGDEASRWIAAQ
ncbi:hypothetical protein ACRE_055050 [Hapsidospora chrysogenum ATCC 11550]|uniref:Uncharacterized protein n=1 Tax=Hapsidospora chrysogenum (strain ATCC 11550 / CBS 779.69 / DSM 880 / IAM 14645 / JCM 23072 / IMI 49137) TaxID=857340 RepID=A0A086T2Z9_HAPC1|nr:hypothetical protein ACRE_055050 [Hapsidospora chrysogenum ATCC 11550]